MKSRPQWFVLFLTAAFWLTVDFAAAEIFTAGNPPTQVLTAGKSSQKLLSAGQVSSRVAVYEGSAAPLPFVVIGKITVRASSRDELMPAFKAAASLQGGDAVIAYKIIDRGTVPDSIQFTSQKTTQNPTSQESANGIAGQNIREPVAEGVVIRFDPNGIKELSATTIVPVLN